MWVFGFVVVCAGALFVLMKQTQVAEDAAPYGMAEPKLTQEKAKAFLEDVRQNPEKRRALTQALPEAFRQDTSLIIENPQFIGRNTQNQAWQVRAARAVQPEGQGALYLEKLVATVAKKGIQNVHIKAPSGFLDDAQNLLTLQEGFTGIVYNHNTTGEQADYHLRDQQIKGAVLSAWGKYGRMTARTFFADFEKEKAKFTGNVHLQLTLNKANFTANGGQK